MTDITATCIEPYLGTFMGSFAAANYKPETIKGYRNLTRKLGQLMDTAGMAPSALTPDLAEQLGRAGEPETTGTIRLYSLGRKFAEHLIEIGIARPEPPTEAQIARRSLLANFETYLVKQRGLSPRTIYASLRFADRFLDHRFGTEAMDLGGLRPADAIGFVQYLLLRKRPYRDKTGVTHLRNFFQYMFAQGATATNLALCVPKATISRDKRLPRHLSPEGVEAVLGWVRRNPRHGARDYAMLLVMARLGLRAPEVIKDALDATGQKPPTPYVGSHILRHSLATQLVNAGASLDEVGDMLRHRSRSSAMVYARLDIDGLRSVSQPWPVAGGAQ